jgi:hypothetical protein
MGSGEVRKILIQIRGVVTLKFGVENSSDHFGGPILSSRVIIPPSNSSGLLLCFKIRDPGCCITMTLACAYTCSVVISVS